MTLPGTLRLPMPIRRRHGCNAEAPFRASRKPDPHRVESLCLLTCGFIGGSTEPMTFLLVRA
jgi:hypothetical protein